MGIDALRWVTGRGREVAGGWAVPTFDEGGADDQPVDEIYSGTAGVLVALAQARLAGISDFDELAASAVARLRHVVDTAQQSADEPLEPATEDLGLYTGIAGVAAALQMWSTATGDRMAAVAADDVVTLLARRVLRSSPVTNWRDIIAGEAGILVTLAASQASRAAEPLVLKAISTITERLIGDAVHQPGGVDWFCCDDIDFLMPNFSHGGAGVGFALAAAHRTASTNGALAVAVAAANRLLALGLRADGTFAAPSRLPPSTAGPTIAYGWCHGPTGTVRLFDLLALIQPDRGWQQHAESGRRAVRRSGLPTRLEPGFWDNIGACCGTVSVGNMALDTYQATADQGWLDWADELAADVLAHRLVDVAGTRWSHTEHRADPPELPPTAGYMQGAAGIAAYLLRLHHLHAAGPAAPALCWPDNASSYQWEHQAPAALGWSD